MYINVIIILYDNMKWHINMDKMGQGSQYFRRAHEPSPQTSVV